MKLDLENQLALIIANSPNPKRKNKMANATSAQIVQFRSIVRTITRSPMGRMRWSQSAAFRDFAANVWPNITNKANFIERVCDVPGLRHLSEGGSDSLLYSAMYGRMATTVRKSPKVQSNTNQPTAERLVSYIDRFVAQYPNRSDEHIARMAQVAARVNL